IKNIGFGGGTGLQFNSGLSLSIENCVLRNHTTFAILFSPNASANLLVSNTYLTDNAAAGIAIGPSGSGTVKAVLDRVTTYNNGINGIFVNASSSTGTITVSVSDSVVASNANAGISAGSGNVPVRVMVVRSVLANNGVGATAVQNATVRIGQSI